MPQKRLEKSLSRRGLLASVVPAALAAPAALRSARPAGEKPNLLFILLDQMRYNTIAAYGYTDYRTPNLNRLAEDSIVFDKCYVSQPICSPSRSSLLTGTWPSTNGCIQNRIRLRKDVPFSPSFSPIRTTRLAISITFIALLAMRRCVSG